MLGLPRSAEEILRKRDLITGTYKDHSGASDSERAVAVLESQNSAFGAMSKTLESDLATAIRKGVRDVAHLAVQDLSDGCGDKFAIVCVSPAFDGVPLLERHRMVHESIQPQMEKIHAIELKTWTPAQYEKKKGSTS